MTPRTFKTSDLFFSLYSKPIEEKNSSLKVETEFASRSKSYTLESVISHTEHEKFLKLLHLLPENLQYDWNINRVRISVVFYRKEKTKKKLTMESLTIVLVCNASAQLVPDKTLSSSEEIFTEATESRGPTGGCKNGNTLPVNVPKCHGGEIHVFRTKKVQSFQIFSICNPVYTPPERRLLKPWTPSFKKHLECLEVRNQLKLTLQMIWSWILGTQFQQ